MTLAELKKGEKAVILSITEGDVSDKLMEMGCLPGEHVKIEATAPLGDPLIISLSGYRLGIRKSEAKLIVVGKEEKDGKGS